MNALYRPGPMDFIPSFVDRKYGRERIEYAFSQMEKYLNDTYGITVYQEQVMQLSRMLANFTPGQADTLRKAMGKKNIDLMNKLKHQFDKGCEQNGLDKQKTDQIWSDWVKFASYAFNKSHATCYAYVAFQTGYLKAHYPAEYMSAVLTHNLKNIGNLTLYIADCQKHGIEVLGPNVNESDVNFMVNHKGEIVFGLAAIKSVGSEVAQNIVSEREKNGPYKSAIDFVERNIVSNTGKQAINKKGIESLVKSGAFDCFEDTHRAQYLYTDEQEVSFIDKLIKYCVKQKEHGLNSQFSLFGGEVKEEVGVKFPECEQMSMLEKLRYEKEMIGFHLSGHPLDIYEDEISVFVANDLPELEDMEGLLKNNKANLSFGGIITDAREAVGKSGNKYGFFSLEDKEGVFRFSLFGEDYLNYNKFLKTGLYVYVKGFVSEKNFVDKRTGQNTRKVDFKISNIELLEDMFDKHSKSIKLTVPAEKIDENFIKNILFLAKQNDGKSSIEFGIYDVSNDIAFTFLTRKYKVNVRSFLHAIKPMLGSGTINKFNIEAVGL